LFGLQFFDDELALALQVKDKVADRLVVQHLVAQRLDEEGLEGVEVLRLDVE